MDAWLRAHLPWLTGPWGWVLLLVVTVVPMVFVAVRRGAGFETYWRMPLHVLGIVLIVGALRLAGPAIGLPDARTASSLNLILVPMAAFLWAFLRYRGASQGGDVLDGAQARKETRRLKRKYGEDMLTLAGVWIAPEDETKHFKGSSQKTEFKVR